MKIVTQIKAEGSMYGIFNSLFYNFRHLLIYTVMCNTVSKLTEVHYYLYNYQALSEVLPKYQSSL
uniref:Uncharacterized protein n=1 Tax=Arion vulgaris TaxID=1028688 RepID=A0A0B6Y1E9_9EUPU